MNNEINELKALQIHMKKRIDALEKELNELRSLPKEEEIYVTSSSPEDVYAAFTDKARASQDSQEADVEFCCIKLYRGPRV